MTVKQNVKAPRIRSTVKRKEAGRGGGERNDANVNYKCYGSACTDEAHCWRDLPLLRCADQFLGSPLALKSGGFTKRRVFRRSDLIVQYLSAAKKPL
eukprot:8337465-Pyramimonas_sp.AAC.1